jgi:hypothetical protein
LEAHAVYGTITLQHISTPNFFFVKKKERQEAMCRFYHLEVKHGGEEGAGAIT